MRESTARDVDQPALAQSLPRLLRVDRTFGVIDACLAAVAIISIFSDQLTIFLQATFLLLMLGRVTGGSTDSWRGLCSGRESPRRRWSWR